jgi:ankyrin repeat protein
MVVLVAGAALGAAGSEAPLVDAVKRGDTAAVRSLVTSGVEVNAPTPDGSTALHWAVHRDDTAMVEMLLASGARPATASRYGVTPLALAAENGNAAIIEDLLTAGAAADTAPAEADLPIMIAARTGAPEALKVLLAHGASPNVRNVRDQTPLMWAAAQNNGAAVRILIEAGARVDARTTDGADGAARAAMKKAEYTLGGPSTQSPPPTAFTPLLWAVRAGASDAVEVLLDAGADVNDTVSAGESALVIALANAHWQLGDMLLDRGADPNLAGAGWNALHQAVRTRRPNTGFGTPGPIPTGTLESIEVIKKIIAKGVNVNARMMQDGMKDGQRNRLIRTGSTAFLLAAKNTDTEVMHLLLAAGADAMIPNGEFSTPLMVAAGLHIWNPGEDGGSLPGQEEEVLEAVKICVEQGNDVQGVNYQGWTALHGAAFRGVNLIVDYLVEQGARLDAKTEQGWTPWSIAYGLTYSEFYKNQPHTAELLAKLMQERGLSTDGQVVDPKVCLDCGRDASAQNELDARKQFALQQVAADQGAR